MVSQESQERVHAFEESRAERFVSVGAFEKTAILLQPVDDEAETCIRAPFGEQNLKGAFYLVAEGGGSYGASREEFERSHERLGPATWRKRESVMAYRTEEPCRVETRVGNHREATVTARPGDWIVRQQTGEVMAITPEAFAERYEPVGP